jgi:3-hydroxyisobutyrate dehydrogenase-like beta-hydroxyacid dehydrogenase
MQQRGPSVTEGRFEFGFAVPRKRKDLAACLGAAWRNGPLLRLAAPIEPFYLEIVVQGGARWDASSLVQRRRRSAANS